MQVEFEILLNIVCREGGRGKKKNILNQPKFISVPGFGPKTSRESLLGFLLWNLLEALRKSTMRADLAIFLQQRKFEFGD